MSFYKPIRIFIFYLSIHQLSISFNLRFIRNLNLSTCISLKIFPNSPTFYLLFFICSNHFLSIAISQSCYLFRPFYLQKYLFPCFFFHLYFYRIDSKIPFDTKIVNKLLAYGFTAYLLLIHGYNKIMVY